MLHGEIMMNNVVIGEWTAKRRSHDKRDFNDYECHIKYRDLQGYPCEATWNLVGHGHANGALSLAARVLQEGIGRARRIKPDGSI